VRATCLTLLTARLRIGVPKRASDGQQDASHGGAIPMAKKTAKKPAKKASTKKAGAKKKK
jgi:hypothetical protein